MNNPLTPNTVVMLKDHGRCEYLGTDTYFGQTTLHFKRLSDGENLYLLPETVEFRNDI